MKFNPTHALLSLALLAAFNPSARAEGAAVSASAQASAPAAQAPADQAQDLGTLVPTAADIKEGLFPEDACKELEASGFKCMGFKPAIRYSLPASSFALGSAVVPDGLKRQLDVFADVLRSKRGSGRQVRVVGHADASGSQAGNLSLSRSRADAVKAYLVQKGAEAQMLIADGVGAARPKNSTNPMSPENRRVEIGRQN